MPPTEPPQVWKSGGQIEIVQETMPPFECRTRTGRQNLGAVSASSDNGNGIQDLLDELEASKQSRLRAWSVLQRLRMVLWELGSVAIPPPAQKTFEAEGEALEHALRKTFGLRNNAIKSLCSSVRRFRDATIKEECKGDYPHALQALWKALDRAEDLIQN
jgi:hypothetical protein